MNNNNVITPTRITKLAKNGWDTIVEMYKSIQTRDIVKIHKIQKQHYKNFNYDRNVELNKKNV